MADSTTITDENYTTVVKSSYDDVNTALENLLGNISSSGSSGSISSTFGMGSSDLAGAGLFYQTSSGEPCFSYKDASGNTKLLPLTVGGTTANTNNMATSTIPATLVSLGGSVYLQAFMGQIPKGQGSGTITFPVAFRSGTTPFVSLSAVEEVNAWNGGGDYAALNTIRQNADGSLQVTNTSINVFRFNASGYSSTNSLSVPTLAIGLM